MHEAHLYRYSHWGGDTNCFQCQVRGKDKKKMFTDHPITNRVYPLSHPTYRRWRTTDNFFSKDEKKKRGKKKSEARASELQETPHHSPVLPLIYLPLLSAGLLRVGQYFHIVLLNTMWAYLLRSPQTAIAYLQRQFAQPLAGLKRTIDAL